jgi:membrane-associated phospholipid phosphatase
MPDERPEQGAGQRSRPGWVAALAVGLAVLAGAAVWAAFTGVGPARFDAAALDESLEERTPTLTALAVVITTLGSTVAMAVLAVAVGAWCWWRGRREDAVLAVGAMAGASLVFRLIKVLLARQRPPVADHLVVETNESLPSGHATMSIVVVGTIVVLAWAGLGALGRAAMVVVAAGWVGAVGATRVYLGVHWISDVLAGWAVGAAWLALCVTAWARWRARVAA